MNSTIAKSLVFIMTLCLLAGTVAAQSVNITAKDGTRWRGQVNDSVKVTVVERGVEYVYEGTIVRAGDRFITIDTVISGAARQKTIFLGDIASISSLGAAPAAETPKAADTPAKTEDIGARKPSTVAASSGDAKKSQPAVAGRPDGVFFLPMEGMVGIELRYNEIEAIGKEADKYGPGQIIVIEINTNGGYVLESEMIDETIQDIQKRHRVVAWVKKAISAGCSLAMACSEIYFMTEGTAGSVTTLAGGSSLAEGPELDKHIQALVDTAKRNGYSEHIARAMKLNRYMCSYDKDPVTGDITWYGDTSGEFVLSDENSNLTFNSSNALHCGFAKGIADTKEDMARMLDLPEWKEVNDYGRKISKKWLDSAARAQVEIPKLLYEQQYAGAAGDAVERIGKLIRIYEELIRWIDRAPNVAERQFGLDKEALQRQIAELRKALADMQRRR